MSSDGQIELEEKLDILSLHPSSSSGHGVLDADDKKSVNNDEHVCQVQSGQMDGLALTPKAALTPRPIHQLQLETKRILSKQALSAIVERPFTRLGRPSNTHARATTIDPAAYRSSPSSARQLVRTSDDSRTSTTMSLKMKSRRPGYTFPLPTHHNSHLPPPNQIPQGPPKGIQVSTAEVQS